MRIVEGFDGEGVSNENGADNGDFRFFRSLCLPKCSRILLSFVRLFSGVSGFVKRGPQMGYQQSHLPSSYAVN